MAYQVLARKWRPQAFEELTGQQHVLQTLTHALDSQRLHHAYLFTGTRGVGKTTIARILAKCLNCEQGISSRPCGQCDACVSIGEGRFMDLIEVDAASRTKVEDTRELLDNVQYAPSRGRYKVYLIDEVHMLSTHSFNALLKTLEEPPPHVKFLLATTDPQKLPVTILSRCLQFHLKNLVPADVVSYLQSVLEAEQIAFDEPALWHLARAAAGSMRDALTLLDQSISFGDGEVREDAVISLLGTPDQRLIHEILEALVARDGAALLEKVDAAAAYNPDFQRLLEQMLSVLHRVAMAQVLPEATDNSEGDRKRIIGFASQCSAEDIQLYYQIALNAIEDMGHAPDRRMAFEMTLLRMLAFSPDVFAASGQAAEQKKKPSAPIEPPETRAREAEEAMAEADPDPDPEPEPGPVPEPEPQQPSLSDGDPANDAPPESLAESGEGVRTEAETAKSPAGETGQEAGTRIPLERLDHDSWAEVVRNCGLSGISANVLANCALESREDNRLSLVLDERQSALYAPEHREQFEQALGRYFERSLVLELRIDTPDGESPAARRQRRRREQLDEARERFVQDANVQSMLETFSATIEQDSLQAAKAQEDRL